MKLKLCTEGFFEVGNLMKLIIFDEIENFPYLNAIFVILVPKNGSKILLLPKKWKLCTQRLFEDVNSMEVIVFDEIEKLHYFKAIVEILGPENGSKLKQIRKKYTHWGFLYKTLKP